MSTTPPTILFSPSAGGQDDQVSSYPLDIPLADQSTGHFCALVALCCSIDASSNDEMSVDAAASLLNILESTSLSPVDTRETSAPVDIAPAVPAVPTSLTMPSDVDEELWFLATCPRRSKRADKLFRISSAKLVDFRIKKRCEKGRSLRKQVIVREAMKHARQSVEPAYAKRGTHRRAR